MRERERESHMLHWVRSEGKDPCAGRFELEFLRGEIIVQLRLVDAGSRLTGDPPIQLEALQYSLGERGRETMLIPGGNNEGCYAQSRYGLLNDVL